ncbi:DEAD/SNF2-like helicase [Indivirus ILV1]|uniref:DEAD/SNF2-like helicase n=1 Tax=Indivirus ILV1 TaxID=1977633 RepID=A0A1V0SDA9_9VIRU|nr:DEAD/SNF2-like helicase [Indivirus ILV1]
MNKYNKTLKKWFGFDDFREKQLDIIKTIIEEKKDVCAIMFTGSGKSLCYQFPAVHLDKTVLIISPLIALMNDQKLKMDALKIPTCCLNSTVNFKNTLKDEILKKKYRIILTTPEYLVKQEEFIKELSEKDILCLVAIDEAHVASTWAQDFRTSYTQLNCIREWVPDIPILALTATATKKVQNDIVKVLNLNKPLIIKTTFDRPNLTIKVIPKGKDMIDDIMNVIDPEESTIIYCQTREMTNDIANALTKKKIKSKPYHAGMTTNDRNETHEDFASGKIKCIVATVAFGMGIDCTIRKVIHYGVAKDLESYYQEIGRAGRDGLPSICYMFYALSDFNTINYFTNQITNSTYRNHMIQLTLIMKNFIFSSECRRHYILDYFGEVYTKENCGNCDNCLNVKTVVMYDFSKEGSLLFDVMNLSGNCYGSMMLINILRGSNSKKVLPKFKKSDLFNSGKNRSEAWWKVLINMFINKNYIKEKPISGGHGFTLAMTKKAIDWIALYKIKKGTTLIMNVPEPLKELMPSLQDKLKKTNPDLTPDEMDDLIDLADEKPKKSSNIDRTYELYCKGQTIKQISIDQNLTNNTIENHLVKLYEQGKNIDLVKLGLTDEIHNKITQAIKKIGSTQKLSVIKTGLPKVSYLMIKLSIAKSNKEKEKKTKSLNINTVKPKVLPFQDEKDDKESWEKEDDESSNDSEVIIVKAKKKTKNHTDTNDNDSLDYDQYLFI